VKEVLFTEETAPHKGMAVRRDDDLFRKEAGGGGGGGEGLEKNFRRVSLFPKAKIQGKRFLPAVDVGTRTHFELRKDGH